MLKPCPECKMQVSDKATSCPHCGFPLKSRSAQKKKHMRLPNGFGQICEIRGRNLRRPFRVQITAGWTSDGKPIRRALRPESYFETYNEAYQALVKYNARPFDLSNKTTMQDLYESWLETRKSKVDSSTLARYRTAWAYSSSIHNTLVRDVRILDMRNCIEHGTITYAGKPRTPQNNAKDSMKTLYNLLFDYAVASEIVDKNYARMFTVDSGYIRKPGSHIAYTEEELDKLWLNIDKHPIIDMILIQCYSGWRPGEMCDLKVEDIDLEQGTMTGGLKTKAGINRVVPIHPRIFSLVKSRYDKAIEADSPYLFFKIRQRGYRHKNTHKGECSKFTYASFQMPLVEEVVPLLSLNPAHKGHDGRVTFVTRAKNAKLDEYAIKRLVGHHIDDLTERVYTERSVAWLKSELEKIP